LIKIIFQLLATGSCDFTTRVFSAYVKEVFLYFEIKNYFF